MVEKTKAHSCEVCPATFIHKSHLQRHERTHTAERQSVCPFCRNSFTRTDSARRHIRTCVMRKGRPVPGPLKRGRRFRACDFCSIMKSACDGGQPCSGCMRQDHSCTYTRAEPKAPTHIDLLISGSVSAGRCRDVNSNCNGLQLTRSKTIKFSFLLRYTDPRNNTLQDYFDSFRPTDNSQDVVPFNLNTADFDPCNILDTWYLADFDNDGTLDLNENEPLSSFSSPDFSCTRQLVRQHPSYGPHCENSQMEWRLADIISALGPIPTEKNPLRQATTMSTSTETLFKVENVDAFVKSYFDYWNRHCPVLHRSSFNPETTFTPLLAAVMLIGAIYYSESSAKAARACLNAAENYIFEHHAFRKLLSSSSFRIPGSGVEPLQAGFLIAIPQHWDHYQDSRHRVRSHRYADLISAARNQGLPKLRHEASCLPPMTTADWKSFIKIEEGIRLMTWIFLVDSSHTIFHHTPAKLALGEMTGSLPCDSEQFESTDSGFQQGQPLRQLAYKIPSTKEGMCMLMGDEWTDNSPSMFGRLNHLDLFVLISGLHEIIFNSTVACASSATKTTLYRALSRWRLLWEINTTQSPSQHADSDEFYQHADEYWWLAKLMLDESMPSGVEGKQELDQDCMNDVNNFIKKFSSLGLE